jgi:ATP-dependent Clp protease protease subunit
MYTNPENMTIPVVIENEGERGERSFDIFSRLLRDRIITLNGEVNRNIAAVINAQLMFLDSVDKKKYIELYINSPGGSITDGMSILDTMRLIKAPVHTIAVGMAASMGAFLLSQGEPGHRYSTPNSEIMIHQPLGGFQGQATDFEIHSKRILRMKEKLTRMMSNSTNGKTDFETMAFLCERDNFLEPEEALELGLIDKIL